MLLTMASTPKRKKIIVANWKMNFTMNEASLFVHKLADKVKAAKGLELVLAPALFTLQSLSLQVDRKQFKLAAQNFYWRDFGAFTGEVSIAQLRGIVDYCIIGHSERRHIFGETDKDLREKVAAALRNNVKPILCIGETASEKSFGETNDVIYDQLVGGLTQVTSEDIKNIVIAYEPVWAISTTNNATPCLPEDVAKVVKTIRKHIDHLYGRQAAENVIVLFGGSVDSDNAGSYLEVSGVDGLLIGGASLKLDSFNSIVDKAKVLVG